MLKTIGMVMLVLIGVGIGCAVGMYYDVIAYLPSVASLKDMRPQRPLRVYSRDHQLMAEYGSVERIPIPLSQVPLLMQRAILATEDTRFYQHVGVDFIGAIRATVAVVLSGQKVQGASTITMQLARYFYLTRTKTWDRKLKEIFLAFKIEHNFDKKKILELYLNNIYFGHKAYGVAAAASIYYGKTPNQLSIDEMALIAGLLQAPSRDDPFRDPSAALKRRNHVLRRLRILHWITETEYKNAYLAPVHTHTAGNPSVSAPYFSEMVRAILVRAFGESVYDQSISVISTLDSRAQQAANRALRSGLLAYDRRHPYRQPTQNLVAHDPSLWSSILEHIPHALDLMPAAIVDVQAASIDVLLHTRHTVHVTQNPWSWNTCRLHRGDVVFLRYNTRQEWELAQVPQVQGALIDLDVHNGSVLALVGGSDYQLSQFNRATQLNRQSGSLFKTFIYSAALEKGYTMETEVEDAPLVMENQYTGDVWEPQNSDHQFHGATSLRFGLTHSRNLVSIRVLQEIGIPDAVRYVERFGFDARAAPPMPSMVLGTGIATPLQMAKAYAVFANGGLLVHPYCIESIMDSEGHVVYAHSEEKARRIISSEHAHTIADVLREVIQSGTGKRAQVLNRRDLAGKTGTTNEQIDAWFGGFDAHTTAVVWVGFDDMRSLQEYGAQAALPIWMSFIEPPAIDH